MQHQIQNLAQNLTVAQQIAGEKASVEHELMQAKAQISTFQQLLEQETNNRMLWEQQHQQSSQEHHQLKN